MQIMRCRDKSYLFWASVCVPPHSLSICSALGTILGAGDIVQDHLGGHSLPTWSLHFSTKERQKMNKEANTYEFPFEINAVKKLKCSGASEARIDEVTWGSACCAFWYASRGQFCLFFTVASAVHGSPAFIVLVTFMQHNSLCESKKYLRAHHIPLWHCPGVFPVLPSSACTIHCCRHVPKEGLSLWFYWGPQLRRPSWILIIHC